VVMDWPNNDVVQAALAAFVGSRCVRVQVHRAVVSRLACRPSTAPERTQTGAFQGRRRVRPSRSAGSTTKSLLPENAGRSRRPAICLDGHLLTGLRPQRATAAAVETGALAAGSTLGTPFRKAERCS